MKGSSNNRTTTNTSRTTDIKCSSNNRTTTNTSTSLNTNIMTTNISCSSNNSTSTYTSMIASTSTCTNRKTTNIMCSGTNRTTSLQATVTAVRPVIIVEFRQPVTKECSMINQTNIVDGNIMKLENKKIRNKKKNQL